MALAATDKQHQSLETTNTINDISTQHPGQASHRTDLNVFAVFALNNFSLDFIIIFIMILFNKFVQEIFCSYVARVVMGYRIVIYTKTYKPQWLDLRVYFSR